MRTFSGPLREPAVRPEHPPPSHSERAIRQAAAGFVLLMVTGYVVGYALGGPSPDRRMEGGWIGQLVVLPLALCALVLIEWRRHRATGSRTGKASG